MSQTSDYERLLEPLPGASALGQAMNRIHQALGELPTDPFFEPASLLDSSEKRQRIVNVSPALLNAWTKHVALGTRLRMKVLEDGTCRLLATGGLLPAMSLVRAHMENAGLAAYCLNTLSDAFLRTGDFETLESLMLQTLFGTSMALEKDVESLLTFGEQEPIRIRRAIEALDEFAGKRGAGARRRQLNYALLCEYAHPSMRSARHFVRVQSESDSGWMLLYVDDDYSDPAEVRIALEILLDAMRIGYAASELLRLTSFSTSGAKNIVYHAPAWADGERIWRTIIEEPIPSDGTA